MTLLEIKTAAANFHGKVLADLTVGSLDLGLLSINQAKQTAQLGHDFNFQRKMLTLTVNSVTGGSLGSAVIQGTATVADIKTIVNIGVFDTNDNFRPVPWTTAEEGQKRIVSDNRFWQNRWAERDDERVGPAGAGRFIVRGGSIYAWPLSDAPAYDIDIGIEAYVFDADYTNDNATVTGTLSPDATGTYIRIGPYGTLPLYIKSGSDASDTFFLWFDGTGWALQLGAQFPDTGASQWQLASTSDSPVGSYTPNTPATGTATVAVAANTISDTWTTKGSQYLLWQTVCNLNKLFKTFVPRTEGNLGEPQALADAGLASLILWDDYKLEGFRTHKR